MASRAYPEEYFDTRRQVNVQEPVHVMYLGDTIPTTATIEPLNTNFTFAVIGIVAIVGLLGLFALLGTRGK